MNRRFSYALLAASLTALLFGFHSGNPLKLEVQSLVPGSPTSPELSLVVLGTGGIVMSCLSLWPQRRG